MGTGGGRDGGGGGVFTYHFSYFHNENICCGYTLEVPKQGASNEYPQHIFSCRNKNKNSA